MAKLHNFCHLATIFSNFALEKQLVIMSQNLQNFQNYCLTCGGNTTVCRRKAAGWQAFPDQEKRVLFGFECFVKKETI